jgi:DNA polymerase-4
MADDVWAWCAKANAFGRTVTVKIKFADFRQITRSRTFAAVIACQNDLRWASLDLMRSAFPPAKGIRLVGVTVSNFDKRDAESDLPLFGAAADSSSSVLA